VDVLATTVARALGTSRRAAEVALWGPMNLARRCARVIAALQAAGADEALVRFIQPIDLAIHAAQPTALGDDGLCAGCLTVNRLDPERRRGASIGTPARRISPAGAWLPGVTGRSRW
jgi:hypothetical protein